MQRNDSSIFRFSFRSASRLIGASLVVALPLAGQEQIPRAEHGAARMDYQFKELEKLVRGANVAEVPVGFDPVVWQAFVEGR